jgi:hypothetical protein
VSLLISRTPANDNRYVARNSAAAFHAKQGLAMIGKRYLEEKIGAKV